MLILTRKPGESLYIGEDIKVTVVEIKGHQVRVGIDAPRNFRIYREEIFLQIVEENKAAADSGLPASEEREIPPKAGSLSSFSRKKVGDKKGSAEKVVQSDESVVDVNNEDTLDD